MVGLRTRYYCIIYLTLLVKIVSCHNSSFLGCISIPMLVLPAADHMPYLVPYLMSPRKLIPRIQGEGTRQLEIIVGQ
ncbi:hypothetical protein F4781DRAFT_378828 [Annulohypoxylon bovei var. microspora]|nr:hypothetical protein F4781DRAFT_378828 [Annulohypoxylon bovei var. microspora]